MIRIVAGIFAAFALVGAAKAGALGPMQAHSIALGDVSGVAYYTVAGDSYEIVATVTAGEGATPVRFVAALTAGQQILMSVPQAAGEPPLELVFARLGDNLIVSSPSDDLVMN
jgi:hypothetical protein